jgi:phosphate transport system permease protein
MDYRIAKDKIAGQVMFLLTIASIFLVIIMAVGLFIKSEPILSQYNLWELLTESNWRPMEGKFGFLPFLAGTFWCTALAILIALPISLLMAIYLTEYAHRSIRNGVWGSLLIVPWVSKHVAPLFVEFSSGYTVLAGGIVLSVMIIPLLVSLFMEIFDNISTDLREASLSLGATQWQTIKHVVLRKARPGMIAAVVLALSRTLGETIAVLMVCGNLAIVPGSVLDACYPIPALIANNYGEMLSVPLYDSALMFAAFLLFFVVVILNLGSRIVLLKVKE